MTSASFSIVPCKAVAHSNIALVKYWGKRESPHPDLNLPAVSSLSLSLDELRSETEVHPATSAAGDSVPSRDRFELDGQWMDNQMAQKVFRHLDRVWQQRLSQTNSGATERPACVIRSTNHLPTAGGLASSASGFAALTLAAAKAFGLADDRRVLSDLARRGSGSAARSLWGGFVHLERGRAENGSDCVAQPLAQAPSWPALRWVIVHTTGSAKSVGSTEGMTRCKNTSPYYAGWLESHESDIREAIAAIRAQDLAALGEIMEHSAFKMHASMMASRPPLVYWNATTLGVWHRLQSRRAEGLRAYATSDAGPHLKILCEAPDDAILQRDMAQVQGVLKVQSVGVGPDAWIEVL